jgi:hypothetical protein
MWKYTAVLILSSFAAAQQTQLPDVTQTRLHTLEGWKIRVENRYSSPIVAMHLSINCPTTSEHARFGYQYQIDHLFNYGSDKPVAPGAFFPISIPSAAADCDGGLDAVVFADGHSNGDPEAVQDIYLRRRGVSEGISFSLPLVEQVSHQGSKPVDVAKTLRDKAKTESLDASKSTAERLGERYALNSIAWLLEKQEAWLVPSDAAPQKQPGIEETMQLRGVTHEQAHAIVLKRKLEEWNFDLQGNLDHPSGK